jgi:hypothetical protein
MLASLGLLGEQPVVRGSSAVALLASALGFFWLVVRRFAVRSDMTLLELQETLLRSKNDAWRDDAAELIAELYWQDDAAEGVLVEAMNSDLLDDSLRRTCLESIAEIWIRRGAINTETYDQFVGGPSQVILDAWITASGLKT